MNWLSDTLLQPSSIQAIIVISLVSVIGLELGKLKIFNISLGITFVLFVGIIVGHFNIDINKDMLMFAQNFGLILFIYALGLQVGPGFFSSLKKGGLRLNTLSLGVVLVGTTLMLLIHSFSNISLPNMMGLFMGAVTNTPALGAAQQAVIQLSPQDTKAISDMALACAVTYPMGVIGMVLAIVFMRRIANEKNIFKTKDKKDSDTYIGEFGVVNPHLFGKTILEIMKFTPKHFVISRIWRDTKVTIPTSESILEEGDHLLVICIKSDVETVQVLFGKQETEDWNKEGIDWNDIDNSHLTSRSIIVTRNKINGERVGDLRLRNLYGINITRINRAGINLLPSPHLALQIGDKLTVVGESSSINSVSNILGDEVKVLKEPNLIAIFLGIGLGLILGALPLPFPGMSMPIKLGIAGGPIIVGILMGAFGPRFKITTYTTPSANLMMRRLGLVMYLACLGISVGGHFFETVLRAEGLLWIGIGFVLTVVPVVIVGLIAMKLLKINYSESIGMLCGSMANPIALSYVDSTVDNDEPSVAYATVYPVSMFVRIISAQLILFLLY